MTTITPMISRGGKGFFAEVKNVRFVSLQWLDRTRSQCKRKSELRRTRCRRERTKYGLGMPTAAGHAALASAINE